LGILEIGVMGLRLDEAGRCALVLRNVLAARGIRGMLVGRMKSEGEVDENNFANERRKP
jgi:hypothetical protein